MHLVDLLTLLLLLSWDGRGCVEDETGDEAAVEEVEGREEEGGEEDVEGDDEMPGVDGDAGEGVLGRGGVWEEGDGCYFCEEGVEDCEGRWEGHFGL